MLLTVTTNNNGEFMTKTFIENVIYAIRNNHIGIIEGFIQDKKNLNISDKLGWTPLHEAAYNGKKEIVKLLLQAEVNVDPVDDLKCTPIHYAVINIYTSPHHTLGHLFNPINPDYKDVIQQLLRANASLNIPNDEDITTLQAVHKMKDNEISKLFENHIHYSNHIEHVKPTPAIPKIITHGFVIENSIKPDYFSKDPVKPVVSDFTSLLDVSNNEDSQNLAGETSVSGDA